MALNLPAAFSSVRKGVRCVPRVQQRSFAVDASTRGAALSAIVATKKPAFGLPPRTAQVYPRPSFRTYASQATKSTAMFCYQCEQTEHGTGCTTIGVCGKTPSVSRLQDLLMEGNKVLSKYALEARKLGKKDKNVDVWVLRSIFSTLTNVNFDDARFLQFLNEQQEHLKTVKGMYEQACRAAGKTPQDFGSFPLLSTTNVDALVEQSKKYGLLEKKARLGDDYVGWQELIMYGLKGTCAYAEHAETLGKSSEEVFDQIYETLEFLTHENKSIMELATQALSIGQTNLKVMQLLDEAHTSRFGHPEPTQLRVSAVKGKSILITGHDLGDLGALLEQTKDKGVNVYTHGEMLPGNNYPAFKKYKHLIGNYGGAWQNQKLDFALFPGPIIVTSNCIIEPMKKYKNRIYTRAFVGWPGVKHLTTQDFTPVIQQALEMEGYTEDEPVKYITSGFGRNAVMSVADKVIEAIKEEKIKHFFLIGGCDGAELERSYFKDVALLTPKDTVILTLACGKYRFNHLDFGTVAGIPRLLDIGQCNDAFSAIQIAVALSQALNTDVNSLPLTLVISWFEQKAVAVLLTLLHLGIKGIYLGPRLPGFATPGMLSFLTAQFDLRTIGQPEHDVQVMMAKNQKSAQI